MSKSIAIYVPPLPSLSGGVLVLLQLGEHLARLGFAVRFVIHEESSSLPIYTLVREKTSLPLVPWAKANMGAQHVWIVPEGWPNALILGLRVGARCIVYMQNWAFALKTLPENVYWHQLPVEFLYVSEPVRYAVQQITGKDGPILRPGIDTNLFFAKDVQECQEATKAFDVTSAAQGPVRVAWMPRKNKGLATQIMDAFSQRMAILHPHVQTQWVEISKVAHEKVGQILGSCHIFLSSGFPEGCPLPPLEAMACDCMPVGFTGLGGWDYMRQGADLAFLAKPFFALPHTPVQGMEGGNGFFVEDAHVLAATLALEHAVLLWHRGGQDLERIRCNMAFTAKAYGLDKQFEQIQRLEAFFTK